MENFSQKISDRLVSIEANDPKLATELNKVRGKAAYVQEAKNLSKKLPKTTSNLEAVGSGMMLETIVLRVGRPVLAVNKGSAILQFNDVESLVWKDRLKKARTKLKPKIAAVGRIEVRNHPVFEWIGTGWLVDEEVVITNRHVAREFARSDGNKFVFRRGNDGRDMDTSIDFLEEIGRTEDVTFKIERVLHIEKDNGPDIAFLKVKLVSGPKLPNHIKLAQTLITKGSDIAVIGYPARDSRIPDQQLMEEIFGNVYDKKRLAPGKVTNITAEELLHDCSTLGGNSGSVLLNLDTAEAVGIHFAGRFLETNFAVPSTLINKRLKDIDNGFGSDDDDEDAPSSNTNNQSSQTAVATSSGAGKNSVTHTIPITITVTIGDSGKNSTTTAAISNAAPAFNEDDEVFITEGKPEDYLDREGYNESFLGTGAKVKLPVVKSATHKKDILTYKQNGATEQVLKYEHFSVLMSKSRRQCFYSAVNIDGKTSVGMKRPGWRLDPRIDETAQIMKECYGNAPKFSRGHMTRREDPIWGGTKAATRGNSDSMHVTNTVPQMQGMNAGIWLGLENYALHNARKDKQRISVFTGPIFTPGDPTRFGVRIPQTFWKVIAFIHDDTNKLCATGYEMSQAEFLSENEFVFGKHKTAQRKISRIEKLTGLSFGNLKNLDPFDGDTESFESVLIDFDQIRFF